MFKLQVKEWFLNYGVPSRLHSDQGRNLESSIIAELCSLYNIKKTMPTAYHAEGNNQCERFNHNVASKEMMDRLSSRASVCICIYIRRHRIYLQNIHLFMLIFG